MQTLNYESPEFLLFRLGIIITSLGVFSLYPQFCISIIFCFTGNTVNYYKPKNDKFTPRTQHHTATAY